MNSDHSKTAVLNHMLLDDVYESIRYQQRTVRKYGEEIRKRV